MPAWERKGCWIPGLNVVANGGSILRKRLGWVAKCKRGNLVHRLLMVGLTFKPLRSFIRFIVDISDHSLGGHTRAPEIFDLARVLGRLALGNFGGFGWTY